jgi:hypothetical protein
MEPAIPGTASWAANFASYRAAYETGEISRFPEIRDAVEQSDWNVLRIYLQRRRREMDDQLTRTQATAPDARALQTVAAIALRAEPIDRAHFVGFAHSASADPVEPSNAQFRFARMRLGEVGAVQSIVLSRMGLSQSST